MTHNSCDGRVGRHVAGDRQHQLRGLRIPARDNLDALSDRRESPPAAAPPAAATGDRRRRGGPARQDERERGGKRGHRRRRRRATDGQPALRGCTTLASAVRGAAARSIWAHAAVGGTTGSTSSSSGASRPRQRATSARRKRGSLAGQRSRPRAARRRRARRSAYSAARSLSAGVMCGRRSSFQTPAKPLQAAADPAFHRSQRHALARRELGIGGAVEKGRADGRPGALVELLEAIA